MQITAEQKALIQKQWPIGDLIFIRRVANLVFSSTLAGRTVIVRLTTLDHRQPEEIVAELDWMDYLSSNQMNLARPVRGQNQEFILAMLEYTVAVFEWAPGKALRESGEYTEENLILWGQYLGKMHRLTKNYQTPAHIKPRISWDKEDNFVTAKRSLNPENKLAFEKFNERLQWIQTLSQNRDNFGLIHSDLHNGNFFIENQIITAFDFDDCCFHWFYYDFASAIMWPHIEGNPLSKFMNPIMKGYLTENHFDYSEKELMEWMKYRAIISYHWLQTSMTEGVFDYNPKILEQCQKWLPLLLRV